MTNFGDTAYIKRGFQIDPKRLFYSDSNMALTMLVTLVSGYGILEAGTILGKITESTNRKDRYVPYAIQAPAAGLEFVGGMYLLNDGASDSTLFDVTMEDSYKVDVGDHVAGVDSDGVPIDMGAVTAIDRTTYSNKATIQVAQVDASALTVANGAMLFVQTQTTTPFTNAKMILVEGVDTGVGPDAVGGNASVVVSNAMLYKGLLPNMDAGALIDLGAVEEGQYLILK